MAINNLAHDVLILGGGHAGVRATRIFPDPMSQSMAESWRSGVVKAFERQNAALLGAEPVKP